MNKRYGFLVLASVSTLALSAPAYAQESGGEDFATNDPYVEASGATDVIIVTARRRSESVQDVPSVVNTVTAEQLAELNIRNFTEVQSVVPGLSLNNESNGIGGNAQLRGVDFNVNASGNNPTVEFYLNDAPAQATVVLQQTYDVSQIEVLRGPQGTLRGRASPSGSIAVTTRKPDLYEAGGYVNATGTDIGGMNFNGAFGMPIVEGVLGLRVAGLYDENEANRVTPIRADEDARDPLSRTRSGRVSALFHPADWLRFEGVYQRIDSDQRVWDHYATFPGDEAAAEAAGLPVLDIKDRHAINDQPRLISSIYDIYNWRAEADFAGQTLIYQGQRYEINVDSINNLDPGEYLTEVDLLQATESESVSKSHEIRLQNSERLLGMFDYIFGYFDLKNNPNTNLSRGDVAFLPPAFGGGPIATQDGVRNGLVVPTFITTGGTSHERSIFGNLTFHVTDSTEISAGVRHIDFEGEGEISATGGANFVYPRPTLDESEWIYSASIKHNFSPDMMVYATTGTSWRPPVGAPVFTDTTAYTRDTFIDVEAEESTSYEIGLKSTLFDNRVRFNVAAFYQEFENYPYAPGNLVYYREPGDGGPDTVDSDSNFVSGVPVEIFGVEAEIGVDISDRWDVGLVASYAKGRIKDGLIACNDFNNDGEPDNNVTAPTDPTVFGPDGIGSCNVTQDASNNPRFTATLQSEYSMPVSDRTDAFLRGLFSFYGKSNQNPALDYDDLDAYGLLNLYAGLRDPEGNWEVSLFGKNIFDTQKATTQGSRESLNYTNVGIGSESYTSPYHTIRATAPQEIGLNFRFAFGAR